MTRGDGRTYWLALDAEWFLRPEVVGLGLECGAVGLAAVLEVMCQAKAQNDGGSVVSGFNTVALLIHTDIVEVANAIRYAAAVGVLDDFTERPNGGFTAHVVGWESDQVKAQQADRSARRRREAAEEHVENEVVQ